MRFSSVHGVYRGDVSPAEVAEEGLDEDGETYAEVDRFCYLGDMLNVQ